MWGLQIVAGRRGAQPSRGRRAAPPEGQCAASLLVQKGARREPGRRGTAIAAPPYTIAGRPNVHVDQESAKHTTAIAAPVPVSPVRVLGIDFGATKIAVAVAGVDGTIDLRDELPTLPDHGASQAVERAIERSHELIAASPGTFRAIGVASMGITRGDRVLLAPNVPGWSNLALPAMLRDAFGPIPIHIDNDVKAATLAELHWGALAGIDTGVYLNLGSGIAAGLVVGGRIVRGAHDAAGEIGFNLRAPGEPRGAARNIAPLEEWAGGKALARRAAELGTTTPELFARYAEDAAARAVVDDTLNEIAFHLANLAIALDPSRIVVGAGFMRAADIVLPVLRDQIARFAPFPIEVVPSRFGTDAALVGAIALALFASKPGG